MKQEIKNYQCPYCNNYFFTNRGGFSNHMRYCQYNPMGEYNRQYTANKQKEYMQSCKQPKQKYKLYCQECGKEYELELTEQEYNNKNFSKYCCISCVRSHASKTCDKNAVKEVKCIDCGKLLYINVRASDKNCRCEECKLIHSVPLKQCIICGKDFRRRHAICCSQKCSEEYLNNRKKYLSSKALEIFRETGKKTAQIQGEIKRSKNEIEFCKLCETYFNNVEHNKSLFNGWDADVIIHDIKYAILWNGIWHYKQITKKHSVERVQNRDKIKIEEIKNYGYTPYIIKDTGGYNINFCKEKFDEFIKYLKNNKIIN